MAQLAPGIRTVSLWVMVLLSVGVLYLGPETIMPLASILAAVVGVLLMTWRYILSFFRKVIGRITGKNAADADQDAESDGESQQAHDL